MKCSETKECFAKIGISDLGQPKCLKPKCLKSVDTRSSIVVEANRKKYELQNDGSIIAVFNVDGEMIDGNDSVKCDNLILCKSDKIAILVELKGSDLRHAFSQINKTLDLLEQSLQGYRLYGRVVTSNRTNVPDLRTCPQYKVIKERFLRKCGNFDSRSNFYFEKVEELR